MDTSTGFSGIAADLRTDSESDSLSCNIRIGDNASTPAAQNAVIIEREEASRSSGMHGTVEFLIRRMHHKGDLPAFSNHVAEINSKLSSLTVIDYSSVGDLAKIILKDFSLTNKLLKVVNSALYATLSGKVMTISKAVFLLGFEKVRMIAATLMIYEHLQNKTKVKELKEVAIASYMSGLIAMGVAEKLKQGEREEAFICAMLYNLGKMLVICYLPEEFAEIEKEMTQEGIDEDMASKSVLGVSYNELGMSISRSWNFPDKIVHSMNSIPDGIIEPPRTAQDILRNIANYSNEALSKVMNSGDSVDRSVLLSDLSERYHKTIPLPADQVESLIESAATKIDDYSDIVQADRNTRSFMKKVLQIRTMPVNAVNGSGCDTLPSRQLTRLETDSPVSRPKDLSGVQGVCILEKSIREIEEAIQEGRSLSDVIYLIIETIYRGFDLTRVIFCLRDANRARMVARFGLGENADVITRLFHFQISHSPDIFNIAISQSKGIIIDDALAPTISRNLPKWYRDNIAASSFYIYPLRFKGECIGMFYADKKEKGSILTESQRMQMEELRNTTIQMLTKRCQ